MKRVALMLSLGLVLSIGSSLFAGPVAGPGRSVKTVQGGQSIIYYETFRGGEKATVDLVGDGATDLDVFVYDSRGRLVAQGIGLTDIEVVSFIPNRTETFRIEVRNLGHTWNRYSMLTY